MGSSTDTHEQAMSRIFDRMMSGACLEALFGEGPERALDSYRRFSTERTKPSVIVEMPLMGDPSYDVLTGNYQRRLQPGDQLRDTSQTVAQAVLDWAAGWEGPTPLDLQFELDASGGAEQRPGIHCRHRGQLDAADAFYAAFGEPWRAPLYRTVAERLPEGWHSEYAAVFPGRAARVTRLELSLQGPARERVAGNPEHLRDCFDAMGFGAYDQPMLDTIAELVCLRPVQSLQFDILEDGTLGDTFSLASYLESDGAATRRMFDQDAPGSKLCAAYERLGIADKRWHLIKEALLATKSALASEHGIERVVSLSLPCCTKAKWKGATLTPGKIYLTASAIVR